MRRSGARLLALVLAAGALAAVPASEWEAAAPGYPWNFPQDQWAHPAYRNEWWYLTGHLGVPGEAEPRFAFQFTLFRVGLSRTRPAWDSAWSTRALVMGHAAITDMKRRTHTFSDVLVREIPILGGFGTFPDSTIAWCRGPAGTDDTWRLLWNGEAFDVHAADRAEGLAFQLSTSPEKPRVFQGPGGVSRKGDAPGAASLYTSFTRLATSGWVLTAGDTLAVSGTSWMDQEFGSNQLTPEEVGWDWFSLQLDDRREVMLYLIRNAAGDVVFGRGTCVDPDGAVRYLEPGDWTVRAQGTWRSPATGAVYPAGWQVEIPSEGLRLVVVPLLENQENVARQTGKLFYWEGAVGVRSTGGGPGGRGFVELTGYGDENRPPL